MQRISSNTTTATGGQNGTLKPYVGPRPFKRDKDDQSRFFGRDVETNEIVSLITSHRLVLIYAQSGAGKTSIFNAQVTPELEIYGFEVLPMARVKITTTSIQDTGVATTSPTSTNPISPNGARAFSSIRNKIASVNKDGDSNSSDNKDGMNNFDAPIENLYIYNAIQSLRPPGDSKPSPNLSLFEFLDKYFPSHKDEDGYPLPQVLIFDQLEELFSFYPNKWLDQQKEFFQQVADSLDNNPLLRIVFIIREDFLAQLDPFKGVLPEKLRPRFRLERLHGNESIIAIKGPLTNTISNMDEHEKGNIEEEIKELVDDLLKINIEGPDGSIRLLEGEFVEPIHLQVVCSRWWNERNELSSRHPENKKDKGPLKDLTNVFEALEDFYEQAIHDASNETGVSEREIRNWCQQKLITSSGTRSMIHRDRNSTGGLSNHTIKILEDKYLVRREWRAGSSWYELTHDRMIKAILDSNASWKTEYERKRKNRQRKIVIPCIIAAAVVSLLFVYNYYSELPTSNPILIGNGPLDVAFNPTTNTAYVANAGDNTLSVIDGQTNRVVSNVNVGNFPNSISVNPSTNLIYITNIDDNTLSVIDGQTNRVVYAIAVGTSPFGVSVNPSTNTVYVTNSWDNTLSVIDGQTNSVTNTINVGIQPLGLSVNPDTNTVYVANAGDNTVSVIDGNTNTVVSNITDYKQQPAVVSVNPDTNTVYVANTNNNTVSVIDGNTNTVVSTIAVGDGPNFVFANPSSNTVYVANFDDNTVSVIDGNTNTVVSTIAVGNTPLGLSVNPDTNTVYVANFDDNTVSVIDGNTNTVIKDIPGTPIPPAGINVGTSPIGVSVNPDTNTVYVANAGDNTLSVIDGKTNRVVSNVTVGYAPNGVFANPSSTQYT